VSPKQRLLLNKPVAEKISAMMGSDHFQIAADVAQLECLYNTPLSPSSVDAATAQYRMEGAKIFLSVLQNIANQSPVQPVSKAGQLDHNV
jgi:hypothetical protein